MSTGAQCCIALRSSRRRRTTASRRRTAGICTSGSTCPRSTRPRLVTRCSSVTPAARCWMRPRRSSMRRSCRCFTR
ncbi:hypothetical protein BG61_40880 [Caballeronia glathei]|uniref:Uncharacterized protein n=1 Tax=Caballeronia glathei TaxID=60547 RepID=A0A069PMA5_9BURK|nr:hypothetical protein BG61_40880 [Caballeronia glathei]